MTGIPATFGALLLGGLCSALFSGMLLVQCIIYAKSCQKDTYRIKSVVVSICLLDLIHSALIWDALWEWFIRLFGNEDGSKHIPVSIAISVVVTALVTVVTHAVFSWRIFRLSSRNYWLIVPIVIPAVLRLICACVTSAEMIRLKNFPDFRARYQWLFSLGLALSSLVDVLITSMMMMVLRQNRAKSLSLTAVLDSLIIYTLENGSITAIGSIVSMICWLSMTNLVFLGLYFVIAKLYANSVLAVLNYREHLRRNREVLSSRSDGGAVDLDVIRLPGARNQPLTPTRNTFSGVSGSRDRAKDTSSNIPSSDLALGTRTLLRVNVEKSVQLRSDYEQSDDAETLDQDKIDK